MLEQKLMGCTINFYQQDISDCIEIYLKGSLLVFWKNFYKSKISILSKTKYVHIKVIIQLTCFTSTKCDLLNANFLRLSQIEKYRTIKLVQHLRRILSSGQDYFFLKKSKLNI